VSLEIRPITLRAANAFVDLYHRHNDPTVGHRFSVAVYLGEFLMGVAIVGNPVARCLDDGFTVEVRRTCVLPVRNANSKLYGAAWQASRALGFRRSITYTQHDESGASLRAVGYVKSAELAARKGWADSTLDPDLRAMRDPVGSGGVARVRWEILRS
jgi:hypothetical protein